MSNINNLKLTIRIMDDNNIVVQECSDTTDLEDLEYYNSPTAIREEQRIEEERKQLEEEEIQKEKEKNKLTKEEIEKNILQLKKDYLIDFVKAKNI